MPSNIDDVIDDVDEMASDVVSNLHDAAADTMDDVAGRAEQYLRAEGSVVTRHLLSTIGSESAEIEGGRVHEAYARAPYAAYVEFGTGLNYGTSKWEVPLGVGPFRSPPFTELLVDRIHSWIINKGIEPHDQRYDRRDLAYFIADEIAVEGTKPHPFMRPAWFQYERRLEDRLVAAARRGTR